MFATFTILLIAVLYVLVIIDWSQTVEIAKNPHRWYETNPLLGKHPTVNRVHAHFVMTMILIALMICFINATITFTVLIGMVIWELKCVIGNYKLGIRP